MKSVQSVKSVSKKIRVDGIGASAVGGTALRRDGFVNGRRTGTKRQCFPCGNAKKDFRTPGGEKGFSHSEGFPAVDGAERIQFGVIQTRIFFDTDFTDFPNFDT